MRCQSLAFVSAILIAEGAFAGAPDLTGGWQGGGPTILPEGYEASTVASLCVEEQRGGLFSGRGVAINTYPGPVEVTQCYFVTAYISNDKRVTANYTPYPAVGIPVMAVFEGKWDGRGIRGVARDPGDGGTSIAEFSRSSSACEEVDSNWDLCSPE